MIVHNPEVGIRLRFHPVIEPIHDPLQLHFHFPLQLPVFAVDAKGRITTGADLAVSDVTTALGYTPWHVGNDGDASGLDADLLDGYNSSLITAASTIPVRDTNGDITTRIFIGKATSAQYADLA